MDQHPIPEDLAWKMLDGKGKFLPESKRVYPIHQWLFSRYLVYSALFLNHGCSVPYHLGYLDKDKTHVVDVLAGAFMLLRKKVLDKIGLLDEEFFHVWWRYRPELPHHQAGYKNYYYRKPVSFIIKEKAPRKAAWIMYLYFTMHDRFLPGNISLKRIRVFRWWSTIAIYFRVLFQFLRGF